MSTPEFKQAIEDVLSYVLAMDDQPSTTWDDIKVAGVASDVGMSFFSSLEPFNRRLLEAMPLEDQPMFASNAFRMYPEEAARVAPNLDICSINDGVDDGGDVLPDVRFTLTRARVVPPAKLRGRVLGTSNLNLELTSAFVMRDLRYVTTRSYVGKVGTAFKVLEYTDRRVSRLSRETCLSVEKSALMYVGIGVARRYTWSVRFGFPSTPSINLMTDAVGVLELLKLRDVKQSRRRDAIVHWVAEHWRRKRRDPEARIRVRPHLRGKTHFTWDGLICEVTPSAADVESNARGEGPATPPWETTDGADETTDGADAAEVRKP